MTNKTDAAPQTSAASVAPEQPTKGGSYLRQKDGTLKRVEFTEAAVAAPVDQQPEA